MNKKSVFIRAIKYSLISSSIIMALVLYKLLTSEAVGSPIEIFVRFLVSCLGALLAMYVVFVLYLHFNPDADEPSKKNE